MGGGFLRGVSKVIHSGGFGFAAAPLSVATSSGGQTVSASMKHAVAPRSIRLPALDDWELITGEEEVRDKAIFGIPPTWDEVSDATTELSNALGTCVPDNGVEKFGLAESFALPSQDLAVTVFSPRRASSPRGESSNRFNHESDWAEPHLFSYTAATGRKNELADALRLLHADPLVQGVVMSIAGDKAVWDAVLNNDKVKELRKKLRDDATTAGVAEESQMRENVNNGEFKGLVDVLMDFSKNACVHVKSILKELVNNLLSFFGKQFVDDKNTDTAIKSTFMLGIMVLSVVILKRAAV